MATYKSDIIRAKDSLDVAGKSLSGEKTGAQVLYATAEYEFGYLQLNANDVIELADIPAGATVVPQLSYATKSFEHGLRVSLGEKDSPGRFGKVGTDLGPGTCGFAPYAPGQAFFGYPVAATITPYAQATRVVAKIEHIALDTPGGSKLAFGIAYRVQG